MEKDETTAGGGWQVKIVSFRLFSEGRALEGTTLPFKFLEILRQYHYFWGNTTIPHFVVFIYFYFYFSFWNSV